MKKLSIVTLAMASLTLLVEAPRAQAQQQPQTQPVQTAPAPVVVQPRTPRYEYETGPDPKLLRNGLWTLSVTYGASIVVAVVSPRASDDYLFIPVAGPWIDLSRRDDDPQRDTKYEVLNKALLIADGVAQALGAANIALSLIFPETRLVEQARRDNTAAFALRAQPIITRHMIGLGAYGHF